MAKHHFVWLAAFLVGCGQYANPNDLGSIAPEARAEVANKRLDSAVATLQYKVEHREISDERRNELIQEVAEEMLKFVDPRVVPAKDQWMYATLLRVTNRWPEAEEALKTAVKVAPNSDRMINDSLKLALAQSKNKKVVEALATANSVINVSSIDVAPILPAVLYEIVPAAQGMGHDVELAELLSKAVECHKRAKIDPRTQEGRDFAIARRFHIRKAIEKISELGGSSI